MTVSRADVYRRLSYEFPAWGILSRLCQKYADEAEAKIPLAWQPAGTTPINQLLAGNTARKASND